VGEILLNSVLLWKYKNIVKQSLSDKTKQELSLTCLFGAFVFLQFTVLGLANHAGEGYLTTGQRDRVYYTLQVFVILGYLLYSLFFRFCTGKRSRNVISYAVFGIFLACIILMSAARFASLHYVIVSMAAALCLGALGGAAHLRMSRATLTNVRVARCMGLGSATAVVLQYLLQIRWGITLLLSVFMLAAFFLFVFLLLQTVPKSITEDDRKPEKTPPARIVFSAVITAAFILFACFYNEYIHHLQIQSDYEVYNVYSWPRLMLVPVYLLFAAVGDRKNGKYVPLASLCIMLIALLNVVLIGSSEAYWLNMCLFYCAIAAFTSYYLLVFWRLAPGTKQPAFWAPFGRMLDSAMVLVTGAIGLGRLPSAVILGVDIGGVALVILLMALGGDLNLSAVEALPAPEAPPTLSPEEALTRMRERYDLTPREAEVLRELVLTEDKQTVISERLNIQVKTLQDYVTRLYRKTGAATRAGLTDLYHENRRQT